ncbi:hypothetical protein H4R23_000385 [Coemansia sp. Cherry 401B]|nr:hypothetical protein H4R23_000385 [Coemansia sp. Cherry 401B]
MLLDRGADPAVVTRLGVTPLMMAVGSRHAWQQRASGVFEWLLTALAQSLIRRDKEGRTAVHWACMRPAHESQDEWKHVSHYYVGALVRRLELSGQREVLTWQNYAGRRAEAVARADGLDAAAALLAAPADRAPLPVTARDIAEAPPRNASPAAEPAGDRYSAFAAQAAHAIQRAASDMRREHQQQLRQIDDDTRFAAKLLLELRSERDATQASAQGYQDVEQRCVRAKAREEQLIQRVESAVNLQQSARASLAVSRAAPESAAGADPQALRAEYRRLRQQAQSYEHESRRLACEYAELAAAVRPWARPPALSAVDMFAEGAGPAAAGSEPGGGPAGAAADERLGWADRGSGVDAEAAEAQAIAAVLQAEERRLGKLERVVSAACGDLSLDRVRTVVGPVLSVLNNGNTL